MRSTTSLLPGSLYPSPVETNLLHIPNISISNLPSVTMLIIVKGPEISNLDSDFSYLQGHTNYSGLLRGVEQPWHGQVEIAVLEIHRNTAAGINGHF